MCLCYQSEHIANNVYGMDMYLMRCTNTTWDIWWSLTKLITVSNDRPLGDSGYNYRNININKYSIRCIENSLPLWQNHKQRLTVISDWICFIVLRMSVNCENIYIIFTCHRFLQWYIILWTLLVIACHVVKLDCSNYFVIHTFSQMYKSIKWRK